jgi:hypothetical protein
MICWHAGFALRTRTTKDDVQMLELISYALTGLGAILVIALCLDLR